MKNKTRKIIQIISFLILSLVLFIQSKFQIFPLNLRRSLVIVLLVLAIYIIISLVREKQK